MKIKKIVTFLIFFILITFAFSTFAANSKPSANASAKDVSKYVNNNDISSVGIDTLLKWYHTVQSSDTAAAIKIDSALKNKTDGEIQGYTSNKSSSYLKENVSAGILSVWKETVSNNEIKQLINEAYTDSHREIEEEQERARIQASIIAPSTFDPSNNQSGDDTKALELGGKIIGIIQAVGNIVAVASLLLIGIKFMLGSAEEKADYKSAMIPYIIGAILIFSSVNLVSILYDIMT